jgi:hypothetical protein
LTDGAGPRTFGFVQLDLGGRLAIADGRYVLRSEGNEMVMVVETLGAPAPPRRRRRRPRESAPDPMPESVPLTRVTLVRSDHPFASEDEAARWLEEACRDEATVDDLVAEGLAQLNRALHAGTVAAGDPHPQAFTPARTAAVRIGYGSGEQVADGAFAEARELDVHGGRSKRHQRDEALGPQERLAGALGGRERLDACETLILRARADLDAGRYREAVLQLRVGLEALLAELPHALNDSGHIEDMATLAVRRDEVAQAAETALKGELEDSDKEVVDEFTALCERILRRRRVLSG